MDREEAEILLYFRENVADLKILGKQWGLTDDDINTCIENAMATDIRQITPRSRSTRVKFVGRSLWIIMRSTTSILKFSCILAAVVVASTIALKNDKVRDYAVQLADPLFYPLFWYSRLATLRIHDIIDVHDYYLEDCLVDNPLFTGSNDDPEMCTFYEHVKTVEVFESSFSGILKHVGGMEAQVFQRKGEVVSLESLQRILSSNLITTKPIPGFKSNLEWPSQVAHLTDERLSAVLAQNSSFYLTWVSKHPSSSQLIRKLFPKPKIFGPDVEISLKKSVFIEGPKSRVNPLSASFEMPFSWYVQGWGSRKAVLTPVKKCLETYQKLDVVLHKGDVLTFNNDLYEVEMHPEGDDISIGFLGFFLPAE